MSPRDFALIAQESYFAKPDIGNADSASRAILRDTPEGLIVAFPGSDNLDCWVHDFDALPITIDGIGRVHQGFWNAWNQIGQEVLDRTIGKEVILVGHSLGAAMAIMAAASYVVSNRPPLAIYAFEPPRTSPDVNLTSLLLKVPAYLYQTGNDLVTDVPEFWHHPAPLIHIGKPHLPIPNVQDHMIGAVLRALS